ncbi:aminoglycoside phosphotransferase family protein [Paenibacillus glycanilyticus]|uniref:aminoglycoside phosphotransferase family protein n=1 Tax=Paenibacillus glycanilyticus TaxID=126569 RepID=UPI002040427C|nr:aminoglycoside phosphotransferase family protein [Paenibacillus glycanilyticus]MCM3628370.1 aminoglycoside phosphotransferase family protein [Paenibacillus glycanilyticus]
MEVAVAEHRIAEWALVNAKALGIDPDHIEASYIYNPGGFSNLSIRLTDGRTRLHVKLAPPHKAERLRQWASIGEYLSVHYTAPKLVHEINQEIVPGYPYGLVFEYIEEAAPLAEVRYSEALLSGVIDMIAKLHRDDHLRTLLPLAEKRTYAEAFEDEYITRFTEDLDGIRASRELLRDFVSDETISWFGEEIQRLKTTVRQTPAFQQSAEELVHNDLNGNNVLTTGGNAFRIIDWDDLTGQGDAAMDYSVLLWPLANDPSWPIWREKVRITAGAEVVERLELYFRAKLLDDVIDVLADYVESEQVPEYREETKRRSKAVHLASYPKYLAKYRE